MDAFSDAEMAKRTSEDTFLTRELEEFRPTLHERICSRMKEDRASARPLVPSVLGHVYGRRNCAWCN